MAKKKKPAAKPKVAKPVAPSRQLIDPQLTAGIDAMLDAGFEATEVARRVVRLIIQRAGKRYTDEFWTKRRTSSLPFTVERLEARAKELEAEWGGTRAEERVKDSLDEMAEWAAGEPRPPKAG